MHALDNCPSDATLVRDEMEIGARGAWLCMRLENYRIFMVYLCFFILNFPSIFGQWTTNYAYMYNANTINYHYKLGIIHVQIPVVLACVTVRNCLPLRTRIIFQCWSQFFSRTFEPPVVSFTHVSVEPKKVSITRMFVKSHTFCLC